MKANYLNNRLVEGLPPEFQQFLDHLLKLDYESRPDYELLIGAFTSLYTRIGGTPDSPFDWEGNAALGPPIDPMQKKQKKRRKLFGGHHRDAPPATTPPVNTTTPSGTTATVPSTTPANTTTPTPGTSSTPASGSTTTGTAAATTTAATKARIPGEGGITASPTVAALIDPQSDSRKKVFHKRTQSERHMPASSSGLPSNTTTPGGASSASTTAPPSTSAHDPHGKCSIM
ncbi:hypothetical protein Pelo_7937 [Pelomyxa schiedti]|nr:hypothetical protein Pelo_7937 [Pelomyxa schiedti]